jgi:hypothetical protein
MTEEKQDEIYGRLIREYQEILAEFFWGTLPSFSFVSVMKCHDDRPHALKIPAPKGRNLH